MFGRLNGVVFIFLIFISSLLGSIFILFPFVPFAYFSPQLWRICADRFVGYWLTFPASLVEFVFGCQFHITGDIIECNRPALIIMNHRTRLDWLFFWNALYKMDPWLLTTEKISLKATLKRIPGAGWAMSCGSYMFLDRNFETDKSTINAVMQYYQASGGKYQLLLFPEGTDRGKRAAEISNNYARKNDLPQYNYVLHPRTTGFNYLVQLMRECNYISNIYDVTIGYEDHIVESEFHLLKDGIFPKNIHFDVKKYSINDIPTDPKESSHWLKQIWSNKEQRLMKFYNCEEKQFVPSGESYIWPMKTNGFGYIAAFAFWIVISIMWIYFTYAYFIVKVYIIFASCFYIYSLIIHNGIDFLAMKWLVTSRIH